MRQRRKKLTAFILAAAMMTGLIGGTIYAGEYTDPAPEPAEETLVSQDILPVDEGTPERNDEEAESSETSGDENEKNSSGSENSTEDKAGESVIISENAISEDAAGEEPDHVPGTQLSDWSFDCSSGEIAGLIELHYYTGVSGDVVIPAQMEYGGKMRTVWLCPPLEGEKKGLFQERDGITSVSICEGVAFDGTSSGDLSHLPYLFYNLKDLESVTINTPVPHYYYHIQDLNFKGLFEGCEKLKSVSLPDFGPLVSNEITSVSNSRPMPQ